MVRVPRAALTSSQEVQVFSPLPPPAQGAPDVSWHVRQWRELQAYIDALELRLAAQDERIAALEAQVP